VSCTERGIVTRCSGDAQDPLSGQSEPRCLAASSHSLPHWQACQWALESGPGRPGKAQERPQWATEDQLAPQPPLPDSVSDSEAANYSFQLQVSVLSYPGGRTPARGRPCSAASWPQESRAKSPLVCHSVEYSALNFKLVSMIQTSESRARPGALPSGRQENQAMNLNEVIMTLYWKKSCFSSYDPKNLAQNLGATRGLVIQR
jgi:hypothetical protein